MLTPLLVARFKMFGVRTLGIVGNSMALAKHQPLMRFPYAGVWCKGVEWIPLGQRSNKTVALQLERLGCVRFPICAQQCLYLQVAQCAVMGGWGFFVGFYILTTSMVISSRALTCDSAHSWRLYTECCPTMRTGCLNNDPISHSVTLLQNWANQY